MCSAVHASAADLTAAARIRNAAILRFARDGFTVSLRVIGLGRIGVPGALGVLLGVRSRVVGRIGRIGRVAVPLLRLRRVGVAVLGPRDLRGIFVTVVTAGAIGRGQNRLLRGGGLRRGGGGGDRPAAPTSRGLEGRLVVGRCGGSPGLRGLRAWNG